MEGNSTSKDLNLVHSRCHLPAEREQNESRLILTNTKANMMYVEINFLKN